MILAKDAEDTLDEATNQHLNRQRNTRADQAKCFMRGTRSRIFWTMTRREVGNLENTFSSLGHLVKEGKEELQQGGLTSSKR